MPQSIDAAQQEVSDATDIALDHKEVTFSKQEMPQGIDTAQQEVSDDTDTTHDKKKSDFQSTGSASGHRCSI